MATDSIDFMKTIDFARFKRSPTPGSVKRCDGHEPQWENVGAIQYHQAVGLFGPKTFWSISCCEEHTLCCSAIQLRRCSKCGRYDGFVVNPKVAFCSVCFKPKGKV